MRTLPILFLASICLPVFAAPEHLPFVPDGGVVVEREFGLCLSSLRSLGRRLNLRARETQWHAFSPRDHVKLGYWVGSRVRFQTVFSHPQHIAAQYRRDYRDVTYQSVYGGSELAHPPLVGAWYEHFHPDPVAFDILVRGSRQLGIELSFRGANGDRYCAWRLPRSVSGVGTIAEVNASGISLPPPEGGGLWLGWTGEEDSLRILFAEE